MVREGHASACELAVADQALLEKVRDTLVSPVLLLSQGFVLVEIFAGGLVAAASAPLIFTLNHLNLGALEQTTVVFAFGDGLGLLDWLEGADFGAGLEWLHV